VNFSNFVIIFIGPRAKFERIIRTQIEREINLLPEIGRDSGTSVSGVSECERQVAHCSYHASHFTLIVNKN